MRNKRKRIDREKKFKDELCVATLNVQHFCNTIRKTRDIIAKMGAQVACLQELHLQDNQRNELHSNGKQYGYCTHLGKSKGGATQLAILTRCHADQWDGLACIEEDGERVMAVRVHRDGLRPLTMCNIYAHANDQVANGNLIIETCRALQRTGEPFIMIGDFNCTVEETGSA